MPTLEHNGLIEMFREKPDLAPHYLAISFHVDVPSYSSVRVANSALDQLIPVEFRADLVLELRDESEAIVLSIVLEAQRDREPRKKYTWLVYVAVARAERECPTLALVIAPDADVATWAAEKIDTGLGLGALQPLVLGPAVVPVVTDPALAEREMELTILSAMAHGNGPSGQAIVEAALLALGRLDQEHATLYFQIIYSALREPMRRALEALIMERQTESKENFPPFMQRLIEGGELRGELKGELKGELRGKRDALLRLVARVGVPLTDDDHARIRACTDGATLDRWLDNVLGARTASDLFR